MKVIYLAAYQAKHERFNITYQDINGKRDIPGDMLSIDLEPYDVIIATPPCNYWSRANWRRHQSIYSLNTKHLLPSILKKLSQQDKPFIVENVINKNLMSEYSLFELPCFVYEIGRHTYWTNIMFNINLKDQIDDFDYRPLGIKSKTPGRLAMWKQSKERQGGQNVHNVIDYWLEVVQDMYYNKDKEEF